MIIILSQKIDTLSEYSDKVFETYHFPAIYKNRIHEGDIFIYYQGNRFVKEQRYYFGVGKIDKIITEDGENYYAMLSEVKKFKKTVPIYIDNDKYVESLGYETVRKSPTPPWQSSIRPLSNQAYDYILSEGGVIFGRPLSVDEKREQLKQSIRAFYLDNNDHALFDILERTSDLIKTLQLKKKEETTALPELSIPSNDTNEGIKETYLSFLHYCEKTQLTYSYKPVLLLAFLECANKRGKMSLVKGAKWVKLFYQNRLSVGKPAEIKRSIYNHMDVTDKEVEKNLLANPIKALVKSGFFSYNDQKRELVIDSSIWSSIGNAEKKQIKQICNRRLNEYFRD